MKVAAIAFHSRVGELEHNLSATKALLCQLANAGVELALFPELSLSGYTKEVPVLKRLQSYQPTVLQDLVHLSEELDMGFAVGFPEELAGHFYIAHWVFYKGALLGVHRKTHLGPSEQEVFTAGHSIDVFSMGKMKIGIQLCYESHFPEISYAQAKQGADMLAYAFASPRETSAEKGARFQRFLPARAYDNGCYVLACNLAQAGVLSCPPLAMVCDPKGKILQMSAEEPVIETLDKQVIESIKSSRMGYFNHEKREGLLRPFYE